MGPISNHIRLNIWGIVALFVALGGTAAALPGKNTIDSGDIKKAQVKRGDLAPNSVDGSKVTDDSLKGADVDEASLNIPQQAHPDQPAPVRGRRRRPVWHLSRTRRCWRPVSCPAETYPAPSPRLR